VIHSTNKSSTQKDIKIPFKSLLTFSPVTMTTTYQTSDRPNSPNGGGGAAGGGSHSAGRLTRLNSVQQKMTDEQVDEKIGHFARMDEESDKTWTRIVVERFLSHFKWYFPRKGMPNAPSLSKAYAYYEHITLPRRLVGEQNADHVLRRAEPGETEPTVLYSVLITPASSLIEWGAGVDLYFVTLRAMSLILLLAGLINLPLIMFYFGTQYDPQGRGPQPGLPTTTFTLRTSAVCRTGEWVVCTDCFPPNPTDESARNFGLTPNGTVLALRNGCDGGQLPQGMVNYATAFFLAIVIGLLSLYIRAREVRFDEDKVTASDYTVVVTNPPPDAYDPDEWHGYFSQFATKQVTCVSIGLNNGLMLRKLIARRYRLRDLMMILPKGADIENEDVVRAAVARFLQEQAELPRGCFAKFFGCIIGSTILPILNALNMFLPPDVLVDRIYQLRDEIKELQKEKYHVSAVYVTFETEEGQRAALSALSASRLDVMANKTSNIPPSAVFRDKVLNVTEPTEPSTVRWMDLGASKKYRVMARSATFFVTVGMIALAGLAVSRVRKAFGPRFSGPLVSIFNSIIPLIVKLLMLIERHKTEGSYQTSLYLKITLFRWVNTAILTKIITPFTLTVSPYRTDVLPQINAILWSEMWITPCLRLLDLWQNIKKHILAPRAPNQEVMNSHFQGTFYNLGERYTDLTKILFVCFFYSALFPGAFFFGFAILTIQYYADRYCLFRIWAWTPSLGSELAKFSRRYFFSGALVAFVFVSAYAFAQFPYDKLCEPSNATTGFSGTYNNVLVAGVEKNITVEQDTNMIFCEQKWSKASVFPFPPTPRLQEEGMRWMTDSQERLTTIYGWTAVAVLCAFVVFFFGSAITNYILSWVRGVYVVKGQDQQIDFSSQEENLGYVPQIKEIGFPFPFLACDIDYIEKELIGWADPAHNYDYHNLIFDVPYEGMPRQRIPDNTPGPKKSEKQQPSSKAPIFSTIKYYPPLWKQQMLKESDD